jgi:SAM-dependent methyltransferase
MNDGNCHDERNDDRHDVLRGSPTEGAGYSHRLARLETQGLRRFIDVQAPYRWNIRRLDLGFVLDVGCGLGRNLMHLRGYGVGVDHNAYSVEIGRSRGLETFTPDGFLQSPFAVPDRFDSLLSAHVLEHLEWGPAVHLVREYLPFVRPGGKVVLICPQRAGFQSDPTHVTYFDGPALTRVVEQNGLRKVSLRSFPFPAPVGRVFTYNETIVIAERPR